MSSCLIITQGNKMYIGADTACSIQTENGYKRVSGNMPKLFSLGQSVFFCSGRKSDAEKCVSWIYDNFKTEIDIEKLESYLKDVFTVVNKDNVFNLEFLLCDYNNHKVVQLSQYNDFNPMIYNCSDELRILCGGYKTKDSFLMAKKNLILNKSVGEIYKDVFESISDECVGGKVVLYNSPASFEIISIEESNIKYVNNGGELFLLTSDFVTSGVVNGSQIIGGDIYSTNYVPNQSGTYLGLNDGSFSFAGGKLKYDETNGLFLQGKVNITDGGKIGTFSIVQNNDYSAIYSGTNSISSNTKGIYLGTNGIRQYESDTANVTIANGVLTAKGANITGTITSENINVTGGSIGGWEIGNSTLTGGNIELNSNGSLKGGSTYTWSIGTDGTATFSNLAITGGSINVNNRFKVDAQGNVTLPSGTKLSWTDVTNTDNIATKSYVTEQGYQTASQVTQITKDTVTTSYVNALKVKAGSVDAENISGTTITGKTISGGSISGSTITIGSGFSVTNSGVMTCTGANVSGTVHLSKGSSLGGWKTDVNSIYSGTWTTNPTNLIFMCTGSTGTVNIAGRSESWVFGAAPNFGVTKTGEMYCKSGEIGNWRFSESCLEGKSSSGQYFVRIYPAGKTFGSYTYYFAIFNNGGGSAPIGGITSSGWK